MLNMIELDMDMSKEEMMHVINNNMDILCGEIALYLDYRTKIVDLCNKYVKSDTIPTEKLFEILHWSIRNG